MAAFHSQKGPELVDKLQSFTPQASARAEMRQPIKMRVTGKVHIATEVGTSFY